MDNNTQLDAFQLRGIAKLLTYLAKWDGGNHGLYAKLIISIPVKKESDPDNDIGLITFDSDGNYVYQGFNVELKGIVKENYSCKNCGTDVETYRNVEEVEEAEEEEESPQVTVNLFTDNFGNTTVNPSKFLFTDFNAPSGVVIAEPAQELDTFSPSDGSNPTVVQAYKFDTNVYNPANVIEPIKTDNPNGFGNHE